MHAHFKTLQTVLFISLIVAATALFVWLVSDYLLSVFWAAVFAILFHPVYERLCVTLRSTVAASVATIGVILAVVLVPAFILGSLVVGEGISLYQRVSDTNFSPEMLVTHVTPLLAPLEQFGIDISSLQTRFGEFAQAISARVGGYALDLGRATANVAIATLLMLYILFFALRDGKRIMRRVAHVLPLGSEKEEMLFERFVAIVRAMFKGTFIIALIQGAIGGVLFALVGIPSAALWAFVMAIFALIPAIGPALVWLPAAILLFLAGNVWQAVVVLVVGFTVISLIDNILRPVLVAHDTKMPDVIILLSVLGGLATFGVAGIIIGPVIAAFFLAMWQLFEHDYADELRQYG